MNQDNLNMLACLESIGKKPVDILLELLQFEAYELDITKSDFTKTLSERIQKTYDITIPDILLDKWIKTKFKNKDNKLVLNTFKDDIDSYIKKIETKEQEFDEKLKEIRIDFKLYAKKMYDLSLTDGNVRDTFNNYFYISSNNSFESSGANQLKEVEMKKSKLNFIFNQYMRHLYTTESEYLEIIENFGIANQMRKVVINEDKESVDRNFLEKCEIYVDTPIMLKALGYDGKELATSYTELLDAIKKAKAKVCFFEHSFDELWGILFSFKKNIVQNFLDAKGVNQFLIAQKEYAQEGKELSLDENNVRNNINQRGYQIKAHIDETDLSDNSDLKHWEFDEKKLKSKIEEHYNSDTVKIYQTRIERDVKSISAISRFRNTSNITLPTSYKEGRFFLLTDNYILLESLKYYYQDSKDNKDFQVNELIFENTILFDLWQNVFDNNQFNKNLLRRKCFAFNEIDEEFKDKLYRICRKSDRYEPERNMSEQFMTHPELQNKVYAEILKKGEYDEVYLKKVMNNEILRREEEFRNETMAKATEEVEKKENEYKKDHEKAEEKGKEQERQDLINIQINKLKKSICKKFVFYIKKCFNKGLTENDYYEFEAKRILGIE